MSGGTRDPEAPRSWAANLFDRFGAPKLFLAVVAIAAWIGAGRWLEWKLDFPAGYGFDCSGSSCLTIEIWHSPVLLQHQASSYDIMLFVWLWSFPAVLLVTLAVLGLRKLRGMDQEHRP